MSHEATPLDLTIRGLYECVSGDAGAPRDWQRMRDLYAPNARIQILHRLEDGGTAIEQLTFEQYRASREPYFAANSFHEAEVDREVAIRGNLAHVYSQFEARRTPDGPAMLSGYNSIQLVLVDDAWKVLSIVWDAHAESPRPMSPRSIPIVD